jgi:hypothetical protein
MGDVIALDLAVAEVDDVEAPLARGTREVGDADEIAGGDAVRIQGRAGALEQVRVDAERRLQLHLRLRRNDRRARRLEDDRGQPDRAGRGRQHRAANPDRAQTQHFPTIQ